MRRLCSTRHSLSTSSSDRALLTELGIIELATIDTAANDPLSAKTSDSLADTLKAASVDFTLAWWPPIVGHHVPAIPSSLRAHTTRRRDPEGAVVDVDRTETGALSATNGFSTPTGENPGPSTGVAVNASVRRRGIVWTVYELVPTREVDDTMSNVKVHDSTEPPNDWLPNKPLSLRTIPKSATPPTHRIHEHVYVRLRTDDRIGMRQCSAHYALPRAQGPDNQQTNLTSINDGDDAHSAHCSSVPPKPPLVYRVPCIVGEDSDDSCRDRNDVRRVSAGQESGSTGCGGWGGLSCAGVRTRAKACLRGRRMRGANDEEVLVAVRRTLSCVCAGNCD
ncbi:hypothetical protein AB1N83_013945, partial [Pleurotus pulmonarius]